MNRKLRALLPLLPLIGACGSNDEAPLVARDVSILAPLSGQTSAVAYLVLENHEDVPIVVSRVSSPEFASVQMHATVFGEGMAEMLRIDSITITPNSSIEFATGGRHVMLMHPVAPLSPGNDVTLEFHYGTESPLIVVSPLETRSLDVE